MTPARAPRARLEVHTHCFVSGPRARGPEYAFSHAHHDGDTPHKHAKTGPASYTIDKDEWAATTGLRGGGRKSFVPQPRGPQLPLVALEDWQRTFRVVFCDTGLTAEHQRAGTTEADLETLRAEFQAAAGGTLPVAAPGRPAASGAAVARLVLACGLTPIYEYRDERGKNEVPS